MKKDIITIQLKDGTEKDMEVILLYSDDITKKDYILYKEPNKNDECYAAKYTINNSIYEIDTNLSKIELTKLQLVLNSSLKENE